MKGIGHVRYATSGKNEVDYAQPLERHHGRLWKWFSFGFNGNLVNYTHLRAQLEKKKEYHFILDNDTEIVIQTERQEMEANLLVDSADEAAARIEEGGMRIRLASGAGVSFAGAAYAAGSVRAAHAARRSIRARTSSGQAMVASANTSAKRPPSLRGTNLPQETPSS